MNNSTKSLQEEASCALGKASKKVWRVGLGTYWPASMEDRIRKYQLQSRRATVGSAMETLASRLDSRRSR
jgi:hypothetical protein